MSAEGPRDPERAGNTRTPNFLYRLYATLWLKACRFKLKVFFLNKRQPKYGRTAKRNSKESKSLKYFRLEPQMSKSRQPLNLPTAASCFPPNYATRFMKKGNHAIRCERKGFSSCNFSILRHTEKQDCIILGRPLTFQYPKVRAQPESLFRPQRFSLHLDKWFFFYLFL